MIAVTILLGMSLILLALALVWVDRRHAAISAALSRAVRRERLDRSEAFATLGSRLSDLQRSFDRTLEDTAPIDLTPLPPPPRYAGQVTQ